MGVEQALGSDKWREVVSVNENPNDFGNESLSTLLRLNRGENLRAWPWRESVAASVVGNR